MPGSIEGYAVSFRLCRVNFAGIAILTDDAKTEAFRASAGLNASRIQVFLMHAIAFRIAAKIITHTGLSQDRKTVRQEFVLTFSKTSHSGLSRDE
jgi:3-oxoacyl-[acyl-carrier-protein] synthase III